MKNLRESKVIIAVSIGLLLAWNVFAFYYARKSYLEDAADIVTTSSQYASQRAADLADSIERNLTYIDGVSKFLAAGVRITNALSTQGSGVQPGQHIASPSIAALNEALSRAQKNFDVNQIFVVNAAGDCIAASDAGLVGKHYADREALKENRKGRFGIQYADKAAPVAGLYFAAPVYIHGQFYGSVYTKINLPELSFLVRQLPAFITDEHGVVVLASDRALEMMAVPDGDVNDLPAEARRARYRRDGFAPLVVESFGDEDFPILKRFQNEPEPHIVVSKKLADFGLAAYIETDLPLLQALQSERRASTVMIGLAGSIIILIGCGMFIYIASINSAKSLLDNEKSHLDTLLQASNDGIHILDGEGDIRMVNNAFCRMSGYSRQELLGMNIGRLDVKLPAQDIPSVIARLVNGAGEIFETRHRSRDGNEFDVEISAVPVIIDGATYLYNSARDITERKLADSQIEFLAYHDALTELPNRRLAKEYMEHAFAYADRSGSKAAILLLDVDNFKSINDSFGHSTGDGLLVAVTQRLRECVRDTDTISRQGGDEFMLLLTNVASNDDITVVADKILDRLEQTFRIEGHEVSTSLSIGISLYPDDGRDTDTLLKLADTAMYHAKEAGRNTYRFYTEQMNVDAVAHQQVRVGLKHALERREFVLHYQPQIDLNNGAVVGAEALIRWQHPELGMVPPGKFIPTAEESGLIVPMGNWVLQEACRQAAQWRNEGMRHLVIAVNISTMQFKRGTLEENVLDALAASGLPPECLELELTESILIHNTEAVLATVERLRSQGIQFSIDDFGTGYSSLAYLKRFNVNKLKIDQSFVKDMVKSPNDATIVRTIIQMARSMNITTIAEGVENEHVAAFLHLQYCDEAQGFHFSKPLPADEFEKYVRKRHAQLFSEETVA